MRELVLDDPAPFIPLVLTKRKKDIEYEAKAVALAGRRYIVCRNREEMKKDAAAQQFHLLRYTSVGSASRHGMQR